jgi:uncharacterized protein (DUF697 family)
VSNEHTESHQSAADPIEPATRLAQAGTIIHRNVLWALGAGAVPFPVADLVAIVAVQVKMLKEMSDLYGVAFREDLAKKLVASLIAGFGGIGVGIVLGGSLAKLLPALGTTFGVLAVPVAAGAFTHATGRVFVMHFESGGTLLDFDPTKVREHFRSEFEAAKAKVAELHRQSKSDNKSA